MKGFSFLALLTAILVQVRFLLKTSAQNPVSGSYLSKDISQLYQVPWHPETNQLRLCSLPLLYIPYALNYSPITKNPQHLNLHTGSSSLPAVQDIPKSWHLRRSQPGREKKVWGSTFYILKFYDVSFKILNSKFSTSVQISSTYIQLNQYMQGVWAMLRFIQLQPSEYLTANSFPVLHFAEQ